MTHVLVCDSVSVVGTTSISSWLGSGGYAKRPTITVIHIMDNMCDIVVTVRRCGVKVLVAVPTRNNRLTVPAQRLLHCMLPIPPNT